MALYVKEERKPTLYEFLKHCFSIEGNSGCFVPTYTDKECTILECRVARRSFEALLEISQTYYPKCSEKALARIIYKLNDLDNLYAYPCGTVKNIVFKIAPESTTKVDLWKSMGSIKMDWKDAGKYTQRDIMFLAKKIDENGNLIRKL